MSVHVVAVGLVNVDAVGHIVPKTSATLNAYMTSSSEIRILPNQSVVNSSDHPTISDYLARELSDGYSLLHIDQSQVITISNYDSYTKGMVVQDSVHQQIHNGILFSADYLVVDLANDGTMNMLVQVNCGAHMRISASVGGDATVYFFENPTVTNAGTLITGYNRNRFSLNTPGCVITHTPTTTSDGTQLEYMLMPGGVGPLSSGGDVDFFNEWILKTGNTYLVRLTNISGGVKPMHIQLDWYEPSQS